MSDLETQFQTAAAAAQSLPTRPSNEELLSLYAHYKQATQGDAGGKRPGFTDPVGRAKYDAWAKLQGTNKEAAMQAYITLVERLQKA
ncbi:MAG: acyl-CoA-binding protein [Chloroflexi bacterium]|nr:acyl-CoA-binding protein [Chloroflexota bacterium]